MELGINREPKEEPKESQIRKKRTLWVKKLVELEQSRKPEEPVGTKGKGAVHLQTGKKPGNNRIPINLDIEKSVED